MSRYSRTFCLGLDIDGALKRSDKVLEGILQENGRPLSAREARLKLQAEKAKGYQVFCGCDNRTEKGGCAGHPAEVEEAEQ